MKKNLSNNKNTGKYKNEITNVIDTMLDRLKQNEDVTEAIVDTASIISQGSQMIPAVSAFMTGMKAISAYTDRRKLGDRIDMFLYDFKMRIENNSTKDLKLKYKNKYSKRFIKHYKEAGGDGV